MIVQPSNGLDQPLVASAIIATTIRNVARVMPARRRNTLRRGRRRLGPAAGEGAGAFLGPRRMPMMKAKVDNPMPSNARGDGMRKMPNTASPMPMWIHPLGSPS